MESKNEGGGYSWGSDLEKKETRGKTLFFLMGVVRISSVQEGTNLLKIVLSVKSCAEKEERRKFR